MDNIKLLFVDRNVNNEFMKSQAIQLILSVVHPVGLEPTTP